MAISMKQVSFVGQPWPEKKPGETRSPTICRTADRDGTDVVRLLWLFVADFWAPCPSAWLLPHSLRFLQAFVLSALFCGCGDERRAFGPARRLDVRPFLT